MYLVYFYVSDVKYFNLSKVGKRLYNKNVRYIID